MFFQNVAYQKLCKRQSVHIRTQHIQNYVVNHFFIDNSFEKSIKINMNLENFEFLPEK